MGLASDKNERSRATRMSTLDDPLCVQAQVNRTHVIHIEEAIEPKELNLSKQLDAANNTVQSSNCIEEANYKMMMQNSSRFPSSFTHGAEDDIAESEPYKEIRKSSMSDDINPVEAASS